MWKNSQISIALLVALLGTFLLTAVPVEAGTCAYPDFSVTCSIPNGGGTLVNIGGSDCLDTAYRYGQVCQATYNSGDGSCTITYDHCDSNKGYVRVKGAASSQSECTAVSNTFNSCGPIGPIPPVCTSDAWCQANTGGALPYCKLGKCVMCRVKFDCNYPAEDCMYDICVTASPLVACVGDGCSAGNWWRDAMTDAANGVCVYWEGLGEPCTMTAWSRFGLEEGAPRVGFPVRLTPEVVADLSNGASLPVDVESMLLGNRSPQPSWLEPGDLNGFAAAQRLCGVGEDDDVDFDVCIADEGAAVYFWVDSAPRDGNVTWNEVELAGDAGLLGFEMPLNTVGQADTHGNSFRYKAKSVCAEGVECGQWTFDVFPARQ